MNRYLQLSPSSFSSFARLSKQISALLRTAAPGGPRVIENVSRAYATQSSLGREGAASGPTRKQITVMSDDGRLRWSELTGKEKVARATQQSFNFMIVVIGAVMTVGPHFSLDFYLDPFAETDWGITGRRPYVPLLRRFLPGQQDLAVQQGSRPHQGGSAMHRTAR